MCDIHICSLLADEDMEWVVLPSFFKGQGK
jgi:hypothetical protein